MSRGLGVRKLRFTPQLRHLPYACDLTSLALSFLICKTEDEKQCSSGRITVRVNEIMHTKHLISTRPGENTPFQEKKNKKACFLGKDDPMDSKGHFA